METAEVTSVARSMNDASSGRMNRLMRRSAAGGSAGAGEQQETPLGKLVGQTVEEEAGAIARMGRPELEREATAARADLAGGVAATMDASTRLALVLARLVQLDGEEG
jgi:hypothetical protein